MKLYNNFFYKYDLFGSEQALERSWSVDIM